MLKIPPEVDVKTLASKMGNSGEIFYELIEEFEIIFSVKPELKTLETAFNQVDLNLRPVRRDSKSFTHFATATACHVKDMEDYGCPVLESSEAPFLMSQPLSNFDPKDNFRFWQRDEKRRE